VQGVLYHAKQFILNKPINQLFSIPESIIEATNQAIPIPEKLISLYLPVHWPGSRK